MVDLEFKQEDLERLIRGDWDLICVPRLRDGKNGQWLGKSVSVEKDGLYLSCGVKDNQVWKHSAGAKVLPFPKFTLAQFKAFCDWHPTFEWEAITSVFTNDDGSFDETALAELDSRGKDAGALVRCVLPCPDDEYLKAWVAHRQIDELKAEIDALKKLEPVTITERMFAKQELETLEARLAEFLRVVTGPAEPEAEPAPQVVPVTGLAESEAPQILELVPLTPRAEPEVQTDPQAVPVVHTEIVAIVTDALSPRPLQRQQAQEQAIMRLIRDEGHDPLKLPKNEPGKPGIKAKVRKALQFDPIFTGETVFEKAWERLRNGKEIADQP